MKNQTLVLFLFGFVVCGYMVNSQGTIENCAYQVSTLGVDKLTQACKYCSAVEAGVDLSTNDKQCISSSVVDPVKDTWKTQGCIQYGPVTITVNSPLECKRCECGYSLDLTKSPPVCASWASGTTTGMPSHCTKARTVGTKITCEECRFGADYGFPFEDYGINSTGDGCVNNISTGNIPKCKKYAAGLTPVCSVCHPGYILNFDAAATADQICLPIPATQSNFYSSCLKASVSVTDGMTLICKACIDSTYRFNVAATECASNTIANCSNQTHSNKCETCTDATFFQPTDKSVCQKLANCATQTKYDVCDLCSANFVLLSDNQTCAQPSVHSTCVNYKVPGSVMCSCTNTDGTNSGKILSWDMKWCVTSSVSNCQILNPDHTGCSWCKTGYVLTISEDVRTWTCVLQPAEPKRFDNCWAAYPSFSSEATQITHCKFCKIPFTGPPTVLAGVDEFGNSMIQSWDSFVTLGDDYQCYGRKILGPGCPAWAIKSDLECAYCGKGYYITRDKKCLPLPKELNRWCETFGPVSDTDPKIECKTCKNGYTLGTTDKVCAITQTQIAMCSHYQADGATCMHCNDGYQLTKNKLQCIAWIEMCFAYDEVTSTSTTSVCTSCNWIYGQVLDSNKSCVKTPTFGCLEIDSSNACIKCANNKMYGFVYDFYLSSGKCISNAGQIANCKSYEVDGSTCSVCHDGATAIKDGTNQITSCSRTVTGCIEYASDSFLCKTCDTGLTLSGDQLFCNSSIAGCKIPAKGANQCAECEAGQFLDPYDPATDAGTTCTALASPVTAGTCLGVNASKKCNKCASGFTLDGSSNCVTITNCKTHHWTALNSCIACNNGFVLKGYVKANDAGTECVAETTFIPEVQEKNKLGKDINNNCLAFLASNGHCAKCKSGFTIKPSSNPPVCEAVIAGCMDYDVTDPLVPRCKKCETGQVVTVYDATKGSGTTCVAIGTLSTDCVVSDGAGTPKCILCTNNKSHQVDGTCALVPNCDEVNTSDINQCNQCSTGFDLRMDPTKTYGECFTNTAIDPLAPGAGVKNVDKEIYNRVPNCVGYDGTGKCNKCANEYKIDNTVAAKPVCIAVTPLIANCKTHTQDGTKCKECQANFYGVNYILSTGVSDSCINTPALANVVGVDNTAPTKLIVQCADGFTIQADQTQCVNTLDNCATLSPIGKELCLKCLTTFKVKLADDTKPQEGGVCVDYQTETVADCEIYKNDGLNCYKCGNNQFLGNPTTCAGDSTDCTKFSPDYSKCQVCGNNKVVQSYSMTVKAGTSCGLAPATNIAGCIAYVDDTHCGATDATKTLPTDGANTAGYQTSELKNFPNCQTHNAIQNSGCMTCNTGAVIKGTTGCVLDTAIDAEIDTTYGASRRPANCIAYLKDTGNCSKCSPKFGLTSTTPKRCETQIANCDVLHPTDNAQCLTCKTGFILAGIYEKTSDSATACVDKATLTVKVPPTNCQAVNDVDTSKCVRCAAGFTIKSDNTCTDKIGTDTTASCDQFALNETEKCVACPDTKFLQASDAAGNLGTCIMRNIADATVDGIYKPFVTNCAAYEATNFFCGRCQDGFGPSVLDGTSIRTCISKIANCKVGATNEVNMCRECNPGFLLNQYDTAQQAASSCLDAKTANSAIDLVYTNVASRPANCIAYELNGKCAVCISGFNLSTAAPASTTKPDCVSVTPVTSTPAIANCVTFDANNKCTACKEPFKLNTALNTCIITSLAQCAMNTNTDANDTTCGTCILGYPKSGTPVTCKQCDNFQIGTDGLCSTTLLKIENCSTSADDFIHCTQCATGYLPTLSMRECVKTEITNCECISKDGTFCQKCSAGFIRSNIENLGTEGAVVGSQCHVVISNCVLYDENGKCTACMKPTHYLGKATTTATDDTCIQAYVDFCVQNASVTADCPKCCTTCAEQFGLFAWKTGTITKHACVFNNLSCALPDCSIYGVFDDWALATCDKQVEPPTPTPLPSTKSSGTISISVTPKAVDSPLMRVLSVIATLLIFLAF